MSLARSLAHGLIMTHLLMLTIPGCVASDDQESDSPLVFKSGSDRLIQQPGKLEADHIVVRLPALYSGRVSLSYDRESHDVSIAAHRVEISGRSRWVDPMAIQVGELRLMARQTLRASFEDDGPRVDGILLQVVARGDAMYRGGEESIEADAIKIENDQLTSNER